MTTEEIYRIARVLHEVNRAYCQALGDDSQPPWSAAPEWQKTSAYNAVDMHLKNPNTSPEETHVSWMKEKESDGWAYGPIKVVAKKLHPCMVPFDELPTDQKAKDFISRAIVHALKPQ